MKPVVRWIAALTLAAAACATLASGTWKDLTVADTTQSWRFGGQVPRGVHWAPDGRSFTYFEPGPFMAAGDLMSADAATLKRTAVLSQARFREALAKLSGLPAEKLAKASFHAVVPSPRGTYLLLPTGQGLFCWDLGASTLTRLTAEGEEAEAPAWSPDESRVAFAAKGSLWVVERATGKKTLLAEGAEPLVRCGSADWLYGEELDMSTGFWWSPDSTRIAYLRFDETGVPTYPIVDQSELNPGVRNQFYPKPGEKNPAVSLRVATVSDGASVPVPGAESGEGYLPRVTWLPDGTGLTYELVNRAQDHLVLDRWSLSAPGADTVLEESSPTWVNVMEGPRFLKDGRFLWMNERDGYAHIYLVAPDGKVLLQLTKGPWVVDEVAGVDEKGGWVYVTGNRDGVLGCQLYRADLKGKRFERLTKGDGWHRIDLAPTADRYLDSTSRAGVPDSVSLVEVKGGRASAVAPNPSPELAEYGFVTPEFVSFTGPSGVTLHAKVIKPRGFDPAKRYPAIVEVYGGPHMQVVQDRWIGRFDVINQLWAQEGFVCFSVDNRGSARRGKAFEDPLMKRTGLHELEDQLAGLAALKALPYVDGARVGIWGWSYGGFMTCYAMTHAPKGSYACGAAVAPVTDWLNYDTCYTERYLKLPKDDPAGYRDSSPAFSADALTGPLFIAQGLVDDNVHFGNSVQMVDALFKAKKPFEMAYYPRMDHGIRGPDARVDLFTRILDFFRRTLQNGKQAG